MRAAARTATPVAVEMIVEEVITVEVVVEDVAAVVSSTGVLTRTVGRLRARQGIDGAGRDGPEGDRVLASYRTLDLHLVQLLLDGANGIHHIQKLQVGHLVFTLQGLLGGGGGGTDAWKVGTSPAIGGEREGREGLRGNASSGRRVERRRRGEVGYGEGEGGL